MGVLRTGARTFLNVMQKACRLSRIPGFTNGLVSILGPTNAANVQNLWEPLCALIDSLVAADNWFNQRDFVDDDSTGEDIAGIPA